MPPTDCGLFAGFSFLLMQMHGCEHIGALVELGFSAGSHFHEHLRMAAEHADHGNAHASIDQSPLSNLEY